MVYAATTKHEMNDTHDRIALPDAHGVSNVDVTALARANATEKALRFVPVGSESWGYCRELARVNMEPYLTRRGRVWAGDAWDEKAPSRDFFQLYAPLNGKRELIGFISVWHDRDNNSLHLGDIQLESAARNQGFGKQAIEQVLRIAQSRGLHEITLNVFRENPAIALYERCGFKAIDLSFDKIKMRYILPVIVAATAVAKAPTT